MNTSQLYSHKAEQYARHRWDYAPAAIEAIFASTGLGPQSALADIGAGTGMLSRHFAGRVRQVYAVEPNAAMLAQMRRYLDGMPGCQILEGTAEAIPLPDDSLDLVLAGQALHWFEPQVTRSEFRRVLKPAGWLAVLYIQPASPEHREAIGEIFQAHGRKLDQPLEVGEAGGCEYYFGPGRYQQDEYPFEVSENWERFFGAIASAASAPEPGDSRYPPFEAALREVFERSSRDGLLTSRAITRLYLGRMESDA